MQFKKKWEQPQLSSLNLMKTQVDITTGSQLGIEMSDDYTAPIDLGDISHSSGGGGGGGGGGDATTYCFAEES